MNVILSIKPKYVERILSGEKRYEFRKRIWKKKVDRVFIYATSPVKKIVAFFTPGEIVDGSPEEIWRYCKNHSGISEDSFFNYFHNKDSGFSIEICGLEGFNEPIETSEMIENFIGPQSFQYRECDIFPSLISSNPGVEHE